MFETPNAVQVRIAMCDIEPHVWRRVIVPSDWTLDLLHLVVQAAFSWGDYHLHEFHIGGLSYGDITAPDESFDGNPRVFDEREVRLRDFLRPTSTFIYIYDFGDNWVHSIEIEKHLFIAPKPKQANCIEGARARPPEDVGGTSGYENFLAVIADPEDPEYADTKRWCGGHFDPEWFDFAVIDKDVRSALKPGAKRRLTQPRLKCAKIASINVITE